jgi:hypothetical protein
MELGIPIQIALELKKILYMDAMDAAKIKIL